MAGIPERSDAFFRLSPAVVGKALCFAVRRGDIKERIDANYFSLSSWVEFAKFPLVKISQYFEVRDGDHNRLPDEEITDAENGIRYLRAQDLKEGTITNEAPVYITRRYYETVKRSHIKPNYLLFSIMASIGNSAIVPDGFPEATANRAVGILVPIYERPRLTQYLFYLFGTELGARLYNRIKKGGLQQRTNLADVSTLEFPLPDEEKQEQLVVAMELAMEERKAKLAKANGLLAELDGYLFTTLGLTPPPKDDRKVFAVQRADVDHMQIGANFYAPDLRNFLQAFSTSLFPTRKLRDEVVLNPVISLKGLAADTPVSFIPMEAVEEGAAGTVCLQARLFSEVQKGYTVFENGDVLWAKITPCMENGKSCIASGLTNGIGFGSTEFHVLRPLSNRVTSEYIHEFVSQASLRRVARFAFTGSAGHQRVPADFLADLPLPVPPIAVQKTIATEARSRREEARRLRAEAEAGWQIANRWFEEQLLSPGQS